MSIIGIYFGMALELSRRMAPFTASAGAAYGAVNVGQMLANEHVDGKPFTRRSAFELATWPPVFAAFGIMSPAIVAVALPAMPIAGLAYLNQKKRYSALKRN